MAGAAEPEEFDACGVDSGPDNMGDSLDIHNHDHGRCRAIIKRRVAGLDAWPLAEIS